jgi:AcrR family transcriptional regulator
MTKIEVRRATQLRALIAAAERTIAEQGLAGLKARDLAAEIGVSLGGLYNIVGDLDEAILHVGARTLTRLDQSLAEAATGEDRPIERLVATALAYCRFADANLTLWRALFEHRMGPGVALPEWHAATQLDLFAHIAAPLRELLPGAKPERRALLSRTLFSAVHGVIALGLEEKLVAVPRGKLEAQVELLVRAVCAGLAAKFGGEAGN